MILVEDLQHISIDPRADIDSGWYPSIKFVAEVLCSAVLLLLLLPLILLLLVLVRMTSSGPGLYSQVRVGLNGRHYRMYKVRTMAHDCERHSGPRWSLAGDPRVTRVGRWLRRSHLDELPQLWNVVRGEMSLVGPRPERPEFVQELAKVIPGYRDRLSIRPGVTGLAQIQLPPDENVSGVRRKVACDAVYLASMGPWLDARILLGTAFKVFGLPPGLTARMLVLPGVPSGDGVSPAATDGEPVSQMHALFRGV